MGVDAEFHCDHGSFSRFTRLLDWRPFHYMTNISVQSFHKLPFKASPVQGIYEYIPVDAEHTKVSMRLRNLNRSWFNMLIVHLFMKRMLDKENKIEFSGQASAVAVTKGAAANIKYEHGVMIFSQTKGGLMYEASVGGQKFKFRTL